MAKTTTIYTPDCVWGAGSFNSTTDLKVGLSSTNNYRGRCTFSSIPEYWNIKTMILHLYRIDTYNAHDLLLGGSSSSNYDATLDFSFLYTFSRGQNVHHNLSIIDYAKTIQKYKTDWYLHIRHGDGSNSYTEFSGNERANEYKPYIYIEYEDALVYYGKENNWKSCILYYGSNGEWQQVIPYYGINNEWKQV